LDRDVLVVVLLPHFSLDAWGSWIPGRLFHPTKVGHSNNLAFAEFEKIHTPPHHAQLNAE
jgi:hypothetical protein